MLILVGKNLIGQRFGRLVVIKQIGQIKKLDKKNGFAYVIVEMKKKQ